MPASQITDGQEMAFLHTDDLLVLPLSVTPRRLQFRTVRSHWRGATSRIRASSAGISEGKNLKGCLLGLVAPDHWPERSGNCFRKLVEAIEARTAAGGLRPNVGRGACLWGGSVEKSR